MSEIVGVLFFVLSALGGLLFIGGIIYLVVFLTRNKDKKTNFNMNTLLHIYFYVVSLVSLAISIIGLVIFVNSLMSYRFGIPFSYQLTTENVAAEFPEEKEFSNEPIPCFQGSPIEIEGQKVCFDTQKQKTEIVNGISFFVSMILIFALHQFGLHMVEKKEKFEWLRKTYNFLSLIGYSIVGIISIPMATFLLVNYIYFRPEDITLINPPSIPLAIALVTIPIWITFLVRTLKDKEKIEN
ncbi:MAG TPA: hypothetical protein P5344_02430 [Candidatus Dojkabacteria bacterium]|jgi:hypothetical protein|nr:hypothetical protein [Candidatus Dojkabacteria bacterium]HRZ84950.1 hypothetical protein [Candidatus Dojkabacteria bacterium]